MAAKAENRIQEYSDGEALQVERGVEVPSPETVEAVRFGTTGAVVLTIGDVDALDRIQADFYMGLLVLVVGIVSMVFFFYGELPVAFRTAFIYGMGALAIIAFRAGYYFGWLKALMR